LTNVDGSDIDIHIISSDLFYADEVSLGTGYGSATPKPIRIPDKASFNRYHCAIHSALVARYGASVRNAKLLKRAIKIYPGKASFFGLEVHIIPCAAASHYLIGDAGRREAHRGVAFLTQKGEWRVSFPEQYYQGLARKNGATHGKLNSCIRIAKRVRNLVVAAGIWRKEKDPSAYLESLLWNVPTEYYQRGDYGTVFLRALNYLYDDIQEKRRHGQLDAYRLPDTVRRLFDSNECSVENALTFIETVLTLRNALTQRGIVGAPLNVNALHKLHEVKEKAPQKLLLPGCVEASAPLPAPRSQGSAIPTTSYRHPLSKLDLNTLALAPDQSETMQASRIYHQICQHIAADADLAEYQTKGDLNGSFRSLTNVDGSDIDIRLITPNLFYTDEVSLGDGYGSATLKPIHTPDKASFNRYHCAIHSSLVARYGSSVYNFKTKWRAIKLHKGKNTYGLEVHIIPCAAASRYLIGDAGRREAHRGVAFLTQKGEWQVNFPEQYYQGLARKNAATHGKLNACIRIAKRVRNLVVAAGIWRKREDPSAYLESLLWNVPTEYYQRGDYGTVFSRALRYLYDDIQEKRRHGQLAAYRLPDAICPLFNLEKGLKIDDVFTFIEGVWGLGIVLKHTGKNQIASNLNEPHYTNLAYSSLYTLED
jgi:hypothetical protein